MLTISILTTDNEVEAIADTWRHLHMRMGTTPFTNYDWYRVWWQHIAPIHRRTPHIIVGKRHNEIVAILPLVVRHRHGMRILENIGFEPFFQGDMIADTRAEADALWQAAYSSKAYDFALIADARPQSHYEASLHDFATKFKTCQNPFIDIKGIKSKDWEASFARKKRQNFERKERRLAEQGDFRFVTNKDAPIPDDLVDLMVSMKGAWSIERGIHGLFTMPETPMFMKALIDIMAQQKELFLSWLECDGKKIAILFCFNFKRTGYAYVITHDIAWSKFGPGSVLLKKGIARMIDDSADRIDLMQGDADYKLNYTDTLHPCHQFFFARRMRGWIAGWLFIGLREFKQRLVTFRARSHAKT